MKRDMDLVRELLLKVERSEEPIDLSVLVENYQDANHAKAAYHVGMMVREAGLLSGNDVSSDDGEDWVDLTLTWRGHEFLDSVRDPEIWRKTKQGLNKIGGGGIDLLIEVGKSYAKMKLSEVTGLSFS